MEAALVCWKCGTSLKEVPQPLSRQSVCLKCGAELYVCKLCEFHDPKLRQGCREDRAEHVQEKEHANFCEWFRPRPGAHVPRDEAPTQAAKAKLDALFGAAASGPAAPDKGKQELEKLFGGKPKN
jgi:hypothetical protein